MHPHLYILIIISYFMNYCLVSDYAAALSVHLTVVSDVQFISGFQGDF